LFSGIEFVEGNSEFKGVSGNLTNSGITVGSTLKLSFKWALNLLSLLGCSNRFGVEFKLASETSVVEGTEALNFKLNLG